MGHFQIHLASPKLCLMVPGPVFKGFRIRIDVENCAVADIFCCDMGVSFSDRKETVFIEKEKEKMMLLGERIRILIVE